MVTQRTPESMFNTRCMKRNNVKGRLIIWKSLAGLACFLGWFELIKVIHSGNRDQFQERKRLRMVATLGQATKDSSNVVNLGDVFQERDEIEELGVVLIIEPTEDGQRILGMK